jgi:thiamine kinase-like enzyme
LCGEILPEKKKTAYKLHSPKEVGELLGAKVTKGTALHLGEDSAVLLVETDSGVKQVYKTMYGPTVEPEFYEEAKSDLLVDMNLIFREKDKFAAFFEYIDAPMLEKCDFSEEEALKLAQNLQCHISEIEGNLPTLFDFSTSDLFFNTCLETLDNFVKLVETKFVENITPSMITHARSTLESLDLDEIYKGGVGFVHGDLHASNVFMLEEGVYKIIDWQFPMKAPVFIDRALLLETIGYSPFNYFPKDLGLMLDFIRIHIFVDRMHNWKMKGSANADAYILSRIANMAIHG